MNKQVQALLDNHFEPQILKIESTAKNTSQFESTAKFKKSDGVSTPVKRAVSSKLSSRKRSGAKLIKSKFIQKILLDKNDDADAKRPVKTVKASQLSEASSHKNNCNDTLEKSS